MYYHSLFKLSYQTKSYVSLSIIASWADYIQFMVATSNYTLFQLKSSQLLSEIWTRRARQGLFNSRTLSSSAGQLAGIYLLVITISVAVATKYYIMK